MKKILLLFGCLFVLQGLQAQDEAVYSHYLIAPITINPSAAGFEGRHQILFNARASWSGFPDAPKNLNMQYNGPVGEVFGVGVGVFTESAGELTRLRGKLNFGFRFINNDDLRVAAGFSVDYQQMSIGNSILGDPFVQAGDRNIENAVDGKKVLDSSFGLYGRYDNFDFGVALNNLIQTRIDNLTVEDNEETSAFDNFTLFTQYEFDQFENFSIRPSVMLRQIKDAPFQFDVNVVAGFLEDQVYAGLSYRQIGALGVLLGGTLEDSFSLFYTFDLSTNDFQQYNSGSHEVTLGFGLGKKSSPFGR